MSTDRGNLTVCYWDPDGKGHHTGWMPVPPNERDEWVVVSREMLVALTQKQSDALAIIASNGFVFTDIGKEPGNWQHLAFTLYNEICEIDVWARGALDLEVGAPTDDSANTIWSESTGGGDTAAQEGA